MIAPEEHPDTSQERLRQLAASLRELRGTLRRVDYRQAEADCELLATALLQEIPRAELDRFRFAAIPRGGLIVLGMLAYALDLNPEHLQPHAGDGALVLVDDCALTGARFASHLAKTQAREVVFVHLYSHPALRQAIREQEERVRACLAAHDLRDTRGVADPEWQERWHRRLGGQRYWYGLPELVCFAWNEPDRPFWNAAAERVEDGWKVIPPHLCLKTRIALAGPCPVPARRTWQSPADVVSGEFDGTLWLCQTTTDRVYSLDGVGAEIFEVEAVQALQDVETFSAQLAASGLLERVDPDA